MTMTSEELFTNNCLFTTLKTGTFRKGFKNKALTTETNQRLNAKKANRVITSYFGDIKIPGDPSSIVAQARELYNDYTFPFDDSGSRGCPIALFPTLVDKLKDFEHRYYECVDTFLNQDNYDELVRHARDIQGDGFDPSMYADKYMFVENCIKPKGFRFNAFQMPQQTKGTVGANYAFELLEAMKSQQKFNDDSHYDWLVESNARHCLNQIDDSLNNPRKGLVQSLEKKLDKLNADPDVTIAVNNSIFERVRDTISIVERMNITENKTISAKVKEVRATLDSIKIASMREPSQRKSAISSTINKLKKIDLDCDLF
jgi:hypothetical protein